MKKNSREAVPIILRRLNKKVKEWRDTRSKQMPEWDDFMATAYAKSFDQSESYKLCSRSCYTSRELFKVRRACAGASTMYLFFHFGFLFTSYKFIICLDVILVLLLLLLK